MKKIGKFTGAKWSKTAHDQQQAEAAETAAKGGTAKALRDLEQRVAALEKAAGGKPK